ncbi:restriction endonuclease subunit S [Elizabethkingia anophelis]|nr:restriction endonuclease subunit S [Elizabethkingia anophelis]
MTFFPNSGNIPKLRFSEFTEEWGTKTLGKIGQVINGLTYSPNDIDEHGVLVLRSSNVQNRTITFTDNVFVKANNFNPVKENDILICVRNGSKNLIGKNALVKKQNEGLAFGAFMAIYRSEFNRFLFQWFDTKDYKDIVNKNLGATINSINGGDLKKFKVPFPSLKEQEKIASFLSLIDERILSQKKIIEKLETLMKGLRERLFSQKLRFKDENDKVNSTWKIKELRQISKIFGGGTPDTNKSEYWNGNIQWFTPTEIKSNFVSKSERTITKEGLRNSSAKSLPKGTILITTRATIGEVAIALEECTTNQGFQSLVVEEGVNNIYLFNWIIQNKIELMKRSNGSTFPEISKSEIEKIKVSFPNLYEQTKIANFLSFIQEKIETEKQILEKLELQKKFLLSNLFV